MVVKRKEAVACPQPQGPPAKTSKKTLSKSESFVCDPFWEECAPVLALIDKAEHLPEDVRDMLKEMVPHSLRTPKGQDQRDPIQNKLLDMIGAIVSGVQAQRLCSLEDAKAQLAEVTDEQGTAVKALSEDMERAAAQRQERDLKKALANDAKMAVEASEQALELARQRKEGIFPEQATAMAALADFERIFTEKFQQLLSGDAQQWRDGWRERPKKVDAVMEALEKSGVAIDVSLKAALPVALKTKPGERGKLAQTAVEFGEQAFQDRIGALKGQVDALEADGATRGEAVATSEEALKAAEEQRNSRSEELTSEEKLLSDLESAQSACEAVVESVAAKIEVASSEVARAEEKSANVCKLAEKFGALRDCSSPEIGVRVAGA